MIRLIVESIVELAKSKSQFLTGRLKSGRFCAIHRPVHRSSFCSVSIAVFYHRQKLIFRQHLDAQFLRFGKFAAGSVSRDNEVCFL